MGLWAGWKTRKKEANTEQVNQRQNAKKEKREKLKLVAGDACWSRHRFGGGCFDDGRHLGWRRFHQWVRAGPPPIAKLFCCKLQFLVEKPWSWFGLIVGDLQGRWRADMDPGTLWLLDGPDNRFIPHLRSSRLITFVNEFFQPALFMPEKWGSRSTSPWLTLLHKSEWIMPP